MPRVALKFSQNWRLRTWCNSLCKALAHWVYPDDTRSVFVVAFVILVPKSVSGTARCFLWDLCELCVCVGEIEAQH